MQENGLVDVFLSFDKTMRRLKFGNIFSKVPTPKDNEIFETLVKNKQLKIERIVSRGQATPQGQWLKQAQDEWVLVLRGEGRLRFHKPNRELTLKAGDYVFIPAKYAHRVEWTSRNKKTIWLAVHNK